MTELLIILTLFSFFDFLSKRKSHSQSASAGGLKAPVPSSIWRIKNSSTFFLLNRIKLLVLEVLAKLFLFAESHNNKKKHVRNEFIIVLKSEVDIQSTELAELCQVLGSSR